MRVTPSRFTYDVVAWRVGFVVMDFAEADVVRDLAIEADRLEAEGVPLR